MPGQESIQTISIQTYKDSSKEFLLRSGEQYFIKRKFGIGEDVNKDKLRHYQLISNILDTKEVELVNWIIDKINGKLDNKNAKKIILDEYEECIIDGYSKVTDDCINDCCDWKEIEW